MKFKKIKVCLSYLCFIIFTHESFSVQLSLKHLKGPLYVVEDDYFYKENSMIYIGEKYITIIGATWTLETALLLDKEIKKITSKPIYEVINTNYHPDRAGGNDYWKKIGAKIISTQMTYNLMKTDWEKTIEFTKKSIPDYPRLPLSLPDNVFQNNFVLQNGDLQSIYTGSSHTYDGIFIYFPKEEVLFGGCILKEKIGNLSFADIKEYPRTIEKLKNLNLKITQVIGGHDEPIHGPELIDNYKKLIDDHNKNHKE
ncbi:subclass B2 metallo-beta-lactamase [Silvanigrella sp.]|jgi:metallo-beta-lactamase class B|uniref:subclass B2 metallo-beta-lactamase n=1 Tax=Silvanigrella sp. TaxID=2024976 RepID=UPI0037C9D71E